VLLDHQQLITLAMGYDGADDEVRSMLCSTPGAASYRQPVQRGAGLQSSDVNCYTRRCTIVVGLLL
jgi:hypothetical protein